VLCAVTATVGAYFGGMRNGLILFWRNKDTSN